MGRGQGLTIAIRHNLAAIRSGEAERLEGELPTEIEPLQQELNALIQSNREIVDRARTHVGNLAHALKTPLSVITNEARERDDPLASKVVEQAELMRTQIAHHLDRARVAARTGAIGDTTDVDGVLKGLKRALDCIYENGRLSSRWSPVPGLNSRARNRTSRRWWGTSWTMPANGRSPTCGSAPQDATVGGISRSWWMTMGRD